MAKYSEKLTEKMVKLIREDNYSITDICNILNVSRKTYYVWWDSKPEFCKAIDNAMEMREEELMVKARQSLKKKLEGYTLTETKYKYVPDEENPTELRLKEKIVRIKEYAPDNKAIQIVLERNVPKKDMGKENNGVPLQITVVDENTRRQLELLHANMGKKQNITQKNIYDASEKLHIKTG